MRAHVIDETCSCGATFRAAGDSMAVGIDVLQWRKGHRHEMPAHRPSVAPSGASEGGAGVPGPPETDASVNTAVGPFTCQDCGKQITQAGDNWIWWTEGSEAARVCKACWHAREDAEK